jgi:serine/threonine-protein kinase
LNHPHICSLYDVGTQDGTDFLVMKLLEGETLAQRLARGALPHEIALDYGRQIADALDAAHRQGIVHRDLKPPNIMLTKAGVKVLDFGLAKQTRVMPASGASESPTRQKDLTSEHALVGTLQYMAPEQLEGKEIDARTDVFAFGAIPYEMLTGRKAFSGGSPASLIAAILDSDPLVPESPPRLGEILKRCLAKSPDERWQSLRDVSALLGWMGDDPAPTAKRSWVVPLAAGLVCAAFAATAAWLLRPQSTQRVVRLSLDLPSETYLGTGVTLERGSSRPSRTSLALSPDGQVLAFSAVGSDGVARLLSRRLEEQESVTIEGTEGAVDLAFSPDGGWIAFWSDGELRKVKLQGGLPVSLCKAPLTFGISWGPNETIAFAGEEGGLWSVVSSGGAAEPLTTLAPERGERSHRLPHFLGDGGVLFTITKSGAGAQSDVALKLSGDAEPAILVEDGADARYVETGHIVFARASVLMAVLFDKDRRQPRRVPVPVLQPVMQSLNSINSVIESRAAQFSISRNGTLVYGAGGVHPTRERTLSWLDRSGRSEALDAPSGPHLHPQLSPDGALVALHSGPDIWVHDIRRGSMTRLPLKRAASHPTWSADGRNLVFRLQPDDSAPGLFRQSSDGSGTATRLTTGPHLPSSWSKDGRNIAFVSDYDLWTVSLEDSRIERVTETPFLEMYPSFSPDGKWLLYSSTESGREEVYIRPFPGPGASYPISTAGGESPIWARTGREIYFLWRNRAAGFSVFDFMAVDVSFSPMFSASRPRKLFESRVQTTEPIGSHDVCVDGRFLILTPYEEPTEKVTEIQVVLNWHEELKRLAPAEN